MIPVMVMGWMLYGVQYSLIQWAITGTICSGLVLFSSASAPAATAKLADAHMLLGYCLCFGNLCFDGFTNSNQDVLNKKYKKNSPLHMMCYVNLWQSIFYFMWFYGLEVNYSNLHLNLYPFVTPLCKFFVPMLLHMIPLGCMAEIHKRRG